MDRDLLEQALAELGQPAYRARQVWERACVGAASYEEMTALPRNLRTRLAERVPFSTLELERRLEARDGTVKALFRTHDGHPVESVLMRYRDGRRSVCVSTQSGCPLQCAFCASGQMGFRRNLSAWEIVEQALFFTRVVNSTEGSHSGSWDVAAGSGPEGTVQDAQARREPGRQRHQAAPEAGSAGREESPARGLSNAALMGMGEPLMNIEAVLTALHTLPDLGIGARHTAISTSGWVPGIDRLAGEGLAVRLALSLHAPDDELRRTLMPVTARFPIAEVIAACKRFYAARRRKVLVEYLMLSGVNDRPEQARALGRLLNPKVFKLNLIPYNETGAFRGSSRTAVDSFRDTLARAGLEATVRVARGREINAACGQLAGTAGAAGRT
ncbi:MAG: 23S rRNA (adenine(2503)-C(2))-methyltransferase RlmN [Gaiellaceae bacterium]|jgi:23S rRNA (adenine2503-C2)-methyltransferase